MTELTALQKIGDKDLLLAARHGAERARAALTNTTRLEETLELTENIKTAKDHIDRRLKRLMNDRQEYFLIMFQWCDVWLEGIRKTGMLIEDGQERGEIASQETGRPDKYNNLLHLVDIGVSPIQSSRWKRLANIHQEDYRTWLEELQSDEQQPTFSRLMSLWKMLNSDIEFAPLPEGIYQVIYADPPWDFQNEFINESKGGQTASAHYETVPTTKICELPVQQISNEESVLFLWVPNSLLMNDGRAVLEAWGFEYKTCMVWIKPKGPSMGWWVVNRHEMLLIGTKAKSPHPKQRPPSIFEGDVNGHSRKPDISYELIQEAYSDPYLELFARRKYNDRWEVWGNEAPQS